MSLRSLAAICVLALAVLAPLPAAACWDGVRIESETVRISVIDEDASWSLDEAQDYADLVMTLDALTPAGTLLDYGFGGLYIEDEGRCELDMGEDWDGYVDASELVEVVARACARSESERAAAEALHANLYTVQVASAGSEAAAERVRTKLLEQSSACYEAHGFYEPGGFPAMNPCAHVIESELEDGREVHRVIVGTFLTRQAANAARVELEAELGGQMMVRKLS